jgi:two-component system, NtrC family, sensor kinase
MDRLDQPVLSLDSFPVPTYAIDRDHVIIHWNKACEFLLSWSEESMVGTGGHSIAFYGKRRQMLCDLLVKDDQVALAGYLRSPLMPGAYETEDYFPGLGERGLWLQFTAAPLRDASGAVVGAVETVRDVTARRDADNSLRRARENLEHLVRKRTAQLAQSNEQLSEDIRQREAAEDELRKRNAELTELNQRLSTTQEQLLQSEKLASIGQLAAGVAHEINNPIGYIFSNFGTLQGYLDNVFQMLSAYQQAEVHLPPAVAAEIAARRQAIDLDFLAADIPMLMAESREGITRVRSIVQDLKDFSRADSSQDFIPADLHHGIDSTLNIVANEIKYKADVKKDYGQLPEIECLPSQINQVVMNLLVNAAHAMGPERGTITVATGADGDTVWFSVADTGCGIPRESLSRIFDPFYTTKPVGKGTGLGLALSYGIIQKHRGSIEVQSEVGRGTTFRVVLPVRQHVEETLHEH